MAERQGFEPWVPLGTHLISSQAHSTALAPLRIGPRLAATFIEHAHCRQSGGKMPACGNAGSGARRGDARHTNHLEGGDVAKALSGPAVGTSNPRQLSAHGRHGPHVALFARRRFEEDHPVDAELIRTHAEVGTPERVGHRHCDVAAIG